MHAHPKPAARGMALIEALVALTVTAVGLVSVLGVQVVLRQNADLAKQRSEAVRLAQQEIETWRSYATVSGPAPAGTVTYDGLASGANADVTGSNTQFTLTRRVTTSAAPAYKTLSVTVGWQDRNAVAQAVQLNTTLAGVAPELAATVVVPADGNPVARGNGRAGGIPRDAKRLSATQSGFRPPQPEGLTGAQVWLFDHATGLITLCSTDANDTASLTLDNITNCQTARAQLLSGFVRFARPLASVGGSPRAPIAGDAEFPVDPPLVLSPALRVQVLRTAPSALVVDCFARVRGTYVAYFCAVPVAGPGGALVRWSGRAVVNGNSVLTDDPGVADPTRQRVCRYTRYPDNRTVGSATIKNEEHPLDYEDVRGPLTNQNFLLIHAGDGSLPFGCPADDPLTPLNTTTFAHPLGL